MKLPVQWTWLAVNNSEEGKKTIHRTFQFNSWTLGHDNPFQSLFNNLRRLMDFQHIVFSSTHLYPCDWPKIQNHKREHNKDLDLQPWNENLS